MGQRTALILQHVNNYLTHDGGQRVETRVFYHNWGIGRVLPLQLVEILNSIVTASPYQDTFSKEAQPQGTDDITDQYDSDTLNLAGFDDPEAVGFIIKNASNNNGGLFVRVTESKEGTTTVEYAYMLGHENGGNYDRFCTFNEWKEKNGLPYIDRAFLEYYFHAVTYFGAIEKSGGERPKIFKN